MFKSEWKRKIMNKNTLCLILLLFGLLFSGCSGETDKSYTVTFSDGQRLSFNSVLRVTFDREGNRLESPFPEENVNRLIELLETLTPAGEEHALASIPDEESLIIVFDDKDELILYDKVPMDDGRYYYTFYSEDPKKPEVLISEKELITPIIEISEE